MTLAKVIEKARQLSRTTTSGQNDTVAMEYVNEAMKAFAKDVHVLFKDADLTVAPRFDIDTTMAIRITIVGGANVMTATDVALCTTDAVHQTGTQVATAFQTTLQAAIVAAGGAGTATVTWSTTTWKFTIDCISGTSITIAAPSGITYSDAGEYLGFDAETTTFSGSTYSVTGDIPEDCAVEVDLPTDFLEIQSVEWDDEPLYSTPPEESPQTAGDPTHYSIIGKHMYLYPSPDNQGRLHIRYKYFPTSFTTMAGYQECGFSGLTLTTSTTLSTSTQYYFKVRVDVGALTEYSITTASDVSFNAVIALLNAALTTVTWSITGGDLRCTSNTLGGNSAIALAVGTTGNSLFKATATVVPYAGWTAFDTAVTHDGNTEIGVDDEWASAIYYYTAYQMALANFEQTIAQLMMGNYRVEVQRKNVQDGNNNTRIEPYRNDEKVLNIEIVP